MSAPRMKLVGEGRLRRQKLAGQFLYCAADRTQQTQQLRTRRLLDSYGRYVEVMPEELRAAIVLFAMSPSRVASRRVIKSGMHLGTKPALNCARSVSTSVRGRSLGC